MTWRQFKIRLSPKPRGCHLVTDQVLNSIDGMEHIETGIMFVFIQHTSASITLNENADPDVRVDMETALSQMVPESMPFIHTCEGSDDMPAHVKSSMFGANLSIPISSGRLALGTWQGIYLCEHRNRGTGRNLIVTICGE